MAVIEQESGFTTTADVGPLGSGELGHLTDEFLWDLPQQDGILLDFDWQFPVGNHDTFKQHITVYIEHFSGSGFVIQGPF